MGKVKIKKSDIWIDMTPMSDVMTLLLTFFMLNTLGNIDCIGSLHSIIVIGEIKDSHYIPVAK